MYVLKNFERSRYSTAQLRTYLGMSQSFRQRLQRPHLPGSPLLIVNASFRFKGICVVSSQTDLIEHDVRVPPVVRCVHAELEQEGVRR